jgi:(p)ppGpp synthase/HD superfamily hydrolase
MRVAGMVSMLNDDELDFLITEDLVAAAWLHDVYEDTDLMPPALSKGFGETVGLYVDELTNRFTSSAYPKMNRKKRKSSEIKRLADVSPEAQLIKLCDRIDNLQTINEKGDKFSPIYCDESEALAEVLTVAPALQVQIFSLTRRLRKKLNK